MTGSISNRSRSALGKLPGSRRRCPAADVRARATITVGYDDLDGVRQLLQFSNHIEILGPEEARRLIRDLAEQIVRAHD
jgi:predicted DNA-binding transcriptional regulator YafY